MIKKGTNKKKWLLKKTCVSQKILLYYSNAGS